MAKTAAKTKGMMELKVSVEIPGLAGICVMNTRNASMTNVSECLSANAKKVSKEMDFSATL